MKNFALIGAAGYIAPRHMKAILDTKNRLSVAYDINDSVGVIDSYFPNADFFTEFERFDRHVEKLKRRGEKIDYMSICSPNYLHDSHVRFALRAGAHAICEKPLVISPWNLQALEEFEKEYKCRVYTILQLRLHPSIIALKKAVEAASPNHRHDVNLVYITPRGKWYQHSWKGDKNKSGGIIQNIGIHFFDMLLWIFGAASDHKVLELEADRASGTLQLKHANVRWLLSCRASDLPAETIQLNQKSFRELSVDGAKIEFTDGFTELHTRCYEQILAGNGFGVVDAKPSIELTYKLRATTA